MTIPSRSAPPVPTNTSNPSISASSSASRTSNAFWQQQSSPAMERQQQNDWIGQLSASATGTRARKVAPPRPPPPRLTPSPNQQKSHNHANEHSLANIFRRMKTNDNRSKDLFSLPPPPAARANNNHAHTLFHDESSSSASAAASTSVELISFDSPPNSPTPTQTSWASSMSFSSDLAATTTSGTHNESGFEDDFSSSQQLDPFSPELGGMPVFGTTTSTLMTPNSTLYSRSSDFLDPLCNGKSLLPPPSANTFATVPTIIRPTVAKAPDNAVHRNLTKNVNVDTIATARNSVATSSAWNNSDADRKSGESYAVVLYQYDAMQEGDLNLMPSEVVVILRRINDDWLVGRNERGVEGMLPAAYVDIKVPLPAVVAEASGDHPKPMVRKAKVLFTFNAQTAEDLTIQENEYVNVQYAINDDWLFGRTMDGRSGQFPAAYVEQLE